MNRILQCRRFHRCHYQHWTLFHFIPSRRISLTFTPIDNSSIICIYIFYDNIYSSFLPSPVAMLHICTLHKLVSERDFNKVSSSISHSLYFCRRPNIVRSIQAFGCFIIISKLCACRCIHSISSCFKEDALFTTFYYSLRLSLQLLIFGVWMCVYFVLFCFFFKLRHKSSHCNRFVIIVTFELLEKENQKKENSLKIHRNIKMPV